MKNLKLVLAFCGHIRIEIVHAYSKSGEMISEILHLQEVAAEERTRWEYVLPEKTEGLASLS